jgi:hypothetical protein
MIRSLSTSAIALTLGAAPAFADLSPQQVWDSLEQYYADFGYQMTVGSRDQAGEALTITDIVLTPAAADPATQMTITIPKIEMHPTGDANVRVMIGGDVVIDSTTPIPDAEPVEFDATISMPDNELIASGTPEDMRLDLTYPAIIMEALIGNGRSEDGGTPLTLSFTDVKGHQQMVSGDEGGVTYDLTANALDLALSATESHVDEGAQARKVQVESRIDGLALSGQMALPTDQIMDPQALHTALASGMAFDGKLSMAAIQGTMDYEGMGPTGVVEKGSASFAGEQGELTTAMSQDGLSYSGTAKAVTTEWTQSDLPFPLSYTVADVMGKLQLPVMQSDQPQPFTLSYSLGGLTIADAIWDMFDPQKTLPRDPASLSIDLQGNALVQKDLLDPALAEEMPGMSEPQPTENGQPAATPEVAIEDIPFLPKDLTINKIALDAVGATADVTGELTFGDDPNQPVGSLQGSFAGINGLLEKLGGMGVLPQEQMMGVRMMLAMFARPVEGTDDQMQTTIEFREGGSIFANGQQVK